MNPIAFIKGILALPMIWKLIKNYGVIKQVLQDVWDVFHSAYQRGGVPTCEESRKLIRAGRLIFENDLVDVPNFDEIKFAETLREVEHQLVCSIEHIEKKEGLKNEKSV